MFGCCSVEKDGAGPARGRNGYAPQQLAQVGPQLAVPAGLPTMGNPAGMPSVKPSMSLPTSPSSAAPRGPGGLRERLEDAMHEAEEEGDADPQEVQFFSELVRRFVRGALLGQECAVVSLKNGSQREAIYKVNKDLNTFFLIDHASKKSDLWAMSSIEVKPAPPKWALANSSTELLDSMALVDYHPDKRMHVFVVVSFPTKQERDIFYAGMKILRLYALKGNAPVDAEMVMGNPTFEEVKPAKSAKMAGFA